MGFAEGVPAVSGQQGNATMRRSDVVPPVFCAAFAALASDVLAQPPDPITYAKLVNHIVEPQPVRASDELVEKLQTRANFFVQRYAEGLHNPRMMAVAADGTVYVTQRKPGNVVMLRDTDWDGVADVQKVVLQIDGLHGIAIRGQRIYLADVKTVYTGDLREDGSISNLQRLAERLPDGGQHPNRTLAFGPDNFLYVSVGSTCNACEETNPESAALLRIDPGSGRREIFATGLRNTIGFGWHPVSGRLYGMDHGIDWLGDDTPIEELNELRRGARYGWPYVYGNGEINPQGAPADVTPQQWAAMSDEPVLGYTAHSAPMQMVFYEGAMFPADYRNDAFVAMRGSWNRQPPSGYEVVRIHFDSAGQPQAIVPFLSGFLTPDPGGGNVPGVLGRPVGLAVARDGALLVGDDTNNVIYRVSYGRPKGTPSPQELTSKVFFDAPATIEVTSPAFDEHIAEIHTYYGKGISPPLSWSSPPEGTESLVLIVEDPDARSPVPFVHWLIANIPPTMKGLPENVSKTEQPREVPKARQGSNSRTQIGYFGPHPFPGEAAHAYHFQIFALDTTLDLPSGFNRKALLEAMSGHVLAKGELVARYVRAPEPAHGADVGDAID